MAQELDQAQRRRPIVLLDDLADRRWESTLDFIAGGTCAPINPKGWTDPLSTPQEVLKRALSKDENGNLALALRESYEQWRDELKQRWQEYEQKLYNDAMMLFGAEGPKAYEERSPGLMNYTGPGPQAWEPIEAALQGNSAALGTKPLASDPRVARYFVKKAAPVLSFKDEDLDLGELMEEQHDPGAVGGKREPIKRRKLVEQDA